MGLRASDFDWRDLKGKDIVDLNINASNESTVTVADRKTGAITRLLLPAVVRHLMEAYHDMESGKPPF